jgi:hypothetical protein
VTVSVTLQMNSDLFGGGDAVVKYVLEGHDRGVNWAVRAFLKLERPAHNPYHLVATETCCMLAWALSLIP